MLVSMEVAHTKIVKLDLLMESHKKRLGCASTMSMDRSLEASHQNNMKTRRFAPSGCP